MRDDVTVSVQRVRCAQAVVAMMLQPGSACDDSEDVLIAVRCVERCMREKWEVVFVGVSIVGGRLDEVVVCKSRGRWRCHEQCKNGRRDFPAHH